MTSPRTRIFVVDDHPLVREWLLTLLRQQTDLEIAGEAEDVKSGLEAMAANPPDVAIVDLSLRNSSGLDLIKELSQRMSAVKIIVLSMHEELFYAERALRAGARGYVTKREATHRIIEAIHTVANGAVYAHPDLLARLTERMVGRARVDSPNTVEELSDRELEVFRRLGGGQPTRQIAEDLQVSIKTIQEYCTRIKGKLALATGAELVREAVRWTENQHRH